MDCRETKSFLGTDDTVLQAACYPAWQRGAKGTPFDGQKSRTVGRPESRELERNGRDTRQLT